MSLNDIAIPYQTPGNQQDLVELGAVLTGSGLTALEARALISTIQRTAEQATLAVVPQILEHVRAINQARIMTMLQQIRALPNLGGFGYVNRDRVIEIIQTVFSAPPRS